MYKEQLEDGLSWQTDKKRILNTMKRQIANYFFLNLCRHMVLHDCYTTKPVVISPGDSVGGAAERITKNICK